VTEKLEVGAVLSRTEWVVMNTVWDLTKGSPNVTVGEVFEAVKPKRVWHVSTLKTLLERLVQKGVLKSTVRGKTCFYEPVARRDAVVKKNLSEVLDNILEGAFGPLVAYLADRKNLSTRDVQAIEKILKENQ